MAFLIKRVPIFLLFTLAAAQLDEYHGYDAHEPVYRHQTLESHGHGHHEQEYELDYHAHPKYAFDYSVKDPHTGDDKEHWETRDGDKVKGTYTVLETDGTKRVVEYEADDKNGFNAVVHKIGTPKEEIKPTYEHYQPEKYEKYEQKYEQKYEPQYEHKPYEYSHSFGNSEASFDDGGFVPIVGYKH